VHNIARHNSLFSTNIKWHPFYAQIKKIKKCDSETVYLTKKLSEFWNTMAKALQWGVNNVFPQCVQWLVRVVVRHPPIWRFIVGDWPLKQKFLKISSDTFWWDIDPRVVARFGKYRLCKVYLFSYKHFVGVGYTIVWSGRSIYTRVQYTQCNRIWDVISLQTLCWEIGCKGRSWNKAYYVDYVKSTAPTAVARWSVTQSSEFLSRVSKLTRDTDIAIMYVCPSVTRRYSMDTA